MSHIHQMLHKRAAEHRAQHAPMQQLAQREAQPDPQNSGSVLSVVFVTAPATFSGPTAGFTTLVAGAPVTAGSSQAQASSAASPTQESSASSTNLSASATSDANSGVFTTGPNTSSDSSASSATDAAASSPTSSQTIITSAAVATTLLTSTAKQNTPTSVGAASAAASPASSSQTGMSNGAKAGLAIGVVVLLVAVAACVLFAYWKKKKDHDAKTRVDNEKAAMAASAAPAAAAPQTQSSVAPRLSLRPMSKMMRFSQGNPLNMANSKPTTAAAVAAANNRQLTPSPQNQNNPFKDPQNPFTDPEKPVNSSVGLPTVPEQAVRSNADMAIAAGAIAPVAVAAVASDDHERQAGGSHDDVVPRPLNPQGAAGGPPGPSNVYRVQLDFKPSMDDELGLQAGQLVRLLHEYDDGWALCVRLDRSQQGVVPRTCLSAKPCKPRPANPQHGSPRAMGPGPNGRMSPAMMNNGHMSPAMTNNGRMSPAMMNNGGMSPAMARPASPASVRGGPAYRTHPQPYSPAHTGSFNQAPRPLSPGPRPQPKRSMSPGPYGANGGPRPMTSANQRRRSNSAGAPYVVRGGRESPGPSRLGPGNGSQWPLHTARPV